MSHRNRSPFAHNTVSLLAAAASRLADAPQLTRRVLKITDRREAQVIVKTTSASSGLFFSLAPTETTKKWSSELAVEVEETYE
jgi:hypothetical protein